MADVTGKKPDDYVIATNLINRKILLKNVII